MADNEQQQPQQPDNIKQETNVAVAGLNMDLSIGQIPKGKLTYALNAAVENFDSNSVNYQNEPGNEFCLQFPTDYHLIGEHIIPEQNKHIFFLVNPETGGSEIGYMDNNDCVYHTYINAACLAFNINYPIHKSVHKITNCSTEIYWTDGLNARRFLNLDPTKKPFFTEIGPDGCTYVPTGVIDCNKMKVQPNFNIPEIYVVQVNNGGNLIAGTYQFAIQYCDATGDGYTSYYSVTNPTPIANVHLTTPDYNYAVGKSIVLNINNIDISGYFKYFNLAVIKTVNDITSVELVGTYYIDQTSKELTYSGQNQTQIPLALADIFEKFPYYDIADDVTSVQDILIWKGVSSIDRINYQKIANKITLQWQTYRIPNTESYSNEMNATNLRGYLRDEVYPFEIVFIKRNGKQVDGFHIPGREKNSNEAFPDVPASNQDFIGSGISAPYWKIYNTASVLGDAQGDNIGNATPYKYGEFAYWESQDETYPCDVNVWGDLAGKPIRHHKFPDIVVSPIFESPTYSLSPGFQPVMQNDAIYPIGVKIDVEQIAYLIATSELSQAEKNDIIAFKIVRGNRSTNRSIVAKGILRNVGKYNREGTNYYYPNYPFNDLNSDPFLLEQNNAYNAQCITYLATITTAGTLQYIDCFTGNVATKVYSGAATDTVCSLTVPIMITGAATFVVTSYYTYQLACLQPNQTTTFRYTSPTSGVITVVVPYGLPIVIDSTVTPVRTAGSTNCTILVTSTKNNSCYPSQLKGFDTDESKYRMVFNSPETSFGQPTLGTILKLENAMFGGGKAHFVEVKKHAMYKLLSEQAQQEALTSSVSIANAAGTFDATAMFTAYQAYLQIYINGITRKNYTYSFNSIGSYDYSADVPNGFGIKQRNLDICQYIIPGFQSVGETNGTNINNYNRESSVYLKTVESKDPLPYPNQTSSIVSAGGFSDSSRFTISSVGNCGDPAKQKDTKVLSYYASIKNDIPNQWGQIYSYDTIDTGFQFTLDPAVLINLTNATQTVFGGDTFINRFAFKTKLPFFIDNRVGAPDDSDIFYDELGNVAYPQYWYSSRSILSDYIAGSEVSSVTKSNVLKNIISIKAHNFDCPIVVQLPSGTTTSTTTTLAPGTVVPSSSSMYYDGKMYLFAYGIPSFYCESSINVDLRQAYNNLEGDFYPHVSTGIPDNWLQESVVPIVFDNTYHYNPTYSKQNTENVFSHLPIGWTNDMCLTHFPYRVIYSDSQQSYTDNRINSWLIYRPISYYDFPQNYGKFTAIDGIQNKAILARFDNKSFVYNSLLTMNTSNPQAAYLGNPSLFGNPPQDFGETGLGYMGSQNKLLIKIPQGQVTIDAKRGQIFMVNLNAYGRYVPSDLSAFGSGLNRFFTDHLSFEILRYFPTVDTDNHFNGIGIHGVYDSKFDRIIITKLDYIPVDNSVLYDEALRKFYINKQYGSTTLRSYIELTDTQYFCNKGWTVSFNANTSSWISFHSYLPNFYIAENNFFYSGLNEGCDLTALAINEIPTPSTTTTTTTAISCLLDGTAEYPCNLAGTAIANATTTTTTTLTPTTTTTTTLLTTTTTTTLTPTTTTTTTLLTTTTTTTVSVNCTLTAGSVHRITNCGLTGGSVIVIPTPTTTTTTTPTPTTTTTTTTPNCTLTAGTVHRITDCTLTGGSVIVIVTPTTTTTTTPIPTTTTTSTTTLAPITLTVTAECIGTGVPGTGKITANGFTGGNGSYKWLGYGTNITDAQTMADSHIIDITGLTSWTTYPLSNTTWYVVIKDTLGNWGYNFATVSCTATTTTTSTTLPPLAFNIGYTCNGINADVSIDTFTGGSGTGYQYANVVFNYASDAYSYGGGFTSGSSHTYTNQSFATSSDLWALIKDSLGNKLAKKVTPTGCTTTTTTTINTSPSWTYQGYSTCGTPYDSTCNNYAVYLDTNIHSSTYGDYRVNGVNVGLTRPADGNCNTDAVWSNQEYTTCGLPYDDTCNNYTVYRDTNICSSTYNNYQVNGVNVGNTEPAHATCNTSPSLSPVGSIYSCSGTNTITTQEVEKDMTLCSSTYGQFYVDGVYYGPTDPSNNVDIVAEIYSIHRCSDGAILYTIPYCIGYLIPGVRVDLGGGETGYVITTLTTNYAGTTTVTQIAGSGCPATYTQFQSPCNSNYYYILGTYICDGQSSEVPDGQCLTNQGTTESPTGTEIFSFSCSDCLCP